MPRFKFFGGSSSSSSSSSSSGSESESEDSSRKKEKDAIRYIRSPPRAETPTSSDSDSLPPPPEPIPSTTTSQDGDTKASTDDTASFLRDFAASGFDLNFIKKEGSSTASSSTGGTAIENTALDKEAGLFKVEHSDQSDTTSISNPNSIDTMDAESLQIDRRPRVFTEQLTKLEHYKQLQGEINDAEMMTSVQWLDKYGLNSRGLMFTDLLHHAHPKCISLENLGLEAVVTSARCDSSNIPSRDPLIPLLRERIEWLKLGSRYSFGVVAGKRPAIIIDCSDAALGEDSGALLKDKLKVLLRDQIKHKEMVFLLAYGSRNIVPWQFAQIVNMNVMAEGLQWVSNLQSLGTANLLGALRTLFDLPTGDIDNVYLIQGSKPDQYDHTLVDYIKQRNVNLDIPFHCIAFNCDHDNTMLKTIAEETGGRYHSFTNSPDDIYSNSDAVLLFEELALARDVLDKIAMLRKGVSNEAATAHVLPELPAHLVRRGHNDKVVSMAPLPMPLLEIAPNHQTLIVPSNSKLWLKHNGLKSKGLGLFKVLAPHAFPLSHSYIESIKKKVGAQVHNSSMTRITWHDGNLMHINVEPVSFFDYQVQLRHAMALYEKRIEWLSSSSRSVFGTITTQHVILVIDMSTSMAPHLKKLQQHLKSLLEEQVCTKSTFNIIFYGSESCSFRGSLVETSNINLQDAWRWILGAQCMGGNNVLGALKRAIEGLHLPSSGETGVYLITCASPDQPQNIVEHYVRELTVNEQISVHCSLYGSMEPEYGCTRYSSVADTVKGYGTLCEMSHGSLHWYKAERVEQSKNIQQLREEIERAQENLVKIDMLLQTQSTTTTSRASVTTKPVVFGTTSPLKTLEDTSPVKTPTTRPQSAKSTKRAKSSTSLTKPAVVTKPALKDVRAKSAVDINKGRKEVLCRDGGKRTKGKKKKDTKYIPDAEELLSSKEWLGRYGLKPLGLHLEHLMSSHKHSSGYIRVTGSRIGAKYCDVFPKVRVKGEKVHMELHHHELVQYEESLDSVIQRYLNRWRWLLQGAHRVFGTILEESVTLCVDTSGSMITVLDEVKRELTALVWTVLKPNNIQFNIIQFASKITQFKPSVQYPTEEVCVQAAEFIGNLLAGGNTCTLDALKASFEDLESRAVYLITDGKPDISCRSLLAELQVMRQSNFSKVHTISLNTQNTEAIQFLKDLSKLTKGRYHHCEAGFEGNVVTHRLLNGIPASLQNTEDKSLEIPVYSGDDLRLLTNMIRKARKFLINSQEYRDLVSEHASAKTVAELDVIGQEMIPRVNPEAISAFGV